MRSRVVCHCSVTSCTQGDTVFVRCKVTCSQVAQSLCVRQVQVPAQAFPGVTCLLTTVGLFPFLGLDSYWALQALPKMYLEKFFWSSLLAVPICLKRSLLFIFKQVPLTIALKTKYLHRVGILFKESLCSLGGITDESPIPSLVVFSVVRTVDLSSPMDHPPGIQGLPSQGFCSVHTMLGMPFLVNIKRSNPWLLITVWHFPAWKLHVYFHRRLL